MTSFPEGSQVAGVETRLAGATTRPPRIIAVLPDVPWPLNSGKRIRQWANVAGLAQVGEVSVLTLGLSVDEAVVPPNLPLAHIETVHLGNQPKAKAGTRLSSGRPWRVSVADWQPAAQRLRELTTTGVDLVWFGSLDAWLELNGDVGSAAAIIDIDDIETEKLTSFLAAAPQPGARARLDRVQARVERKMWNRIQQRAITSAKAVAVCSEADAKLLAASNAVVIPNCFPDPTDQLVAVDEGHTRAERLPSSLLMVGNYSYEPNLDGAQFMARDVMPLILQQHPTAQLRLVGRGGGPGLFALGELPGVHVVGEVESTNEYLRTSEVALAPVRFGGGTRIKLIEAFAYGLPSVSTTVGCHGLDVRDGGQLLVADSARDFAGAVSRLLSDPGLRSAVGQAGRDLYEREYSPTSISSRVAQVTRAALGSSV